jgi:hypothetical protein
MDQGEGDFSLVKVDIAVKETVLCIRDILVWDPDLEPAFFASGRQEANKFFFKVMLLN